jgi:nicotinate phosphoribosyltransferase
MIALADEKVAGEPLMVKVMEKGELVYDFPSLSEIRATAAENVSQLPEKYKKATGAPEYPVALSQELKNLIRKLKAKILKTEVLNSS